MHACWATRASLQSGILIGWPWHRSKDKSGPSAKDLLKKYGSAYLLTSISLSLVSFTVCYVRPPDLPQLFCRAATPHTSHPHASGSQEHAYRLPPP
jgi:hypothetical protein